MTTLSMSKTELQMGSGTGEQVLLRSWRPVKSFRAFPQEILSALKQALTEGVVAVASSGRAGFFDLDLEGVRFFMHLPSRLPYVYLIAVGKSR